MALPSSGTISINDIATEFGGTVPHSLSEYYRGGGLVPDTSTNASVPTSGTISLSNFYGAANTLWDTTLILGNYLSVYGYSTITVPNFGSLVDNTVDFYSGALCRGIYWSGYTNRTYFAVNGSVSNSGWTSMSVAGKTYNRTSASYSYDSGTNATYFDWSEASNIFTNPIGSSYNVSFS